MIDERGTNHRSQCYLSQNSDGNASTYNKIMLLIKLVMRPECYISMSQQLKAKGTC